MKPDTPRVRGKKDWSPMIRSVSFSLGLLVVIGSFVLANKPNKPSAPPPPPKVLMIGDSLSVSGFGDAVREHLEDQFGRQNVAFFASCGSSPENWLRDEPVFQTRCGYRERTPTSDIYRDYHKGKRPPAVATPKVETLIERYKPTILIVQLGTNWMDRSLSDDQIRAILERFVSAAHRGSIRRMIWIGPPDSWRFSKVQNRIYRLIQQSVRRGDPVIDSRRFTRYVLGKTGGDGVHYNRESGQAWAKPVVASIDQILAAEIATRRKVASKSLTAGEHR
jgi:hypothetical protein